MVVHDEGACDLQFADSIICTVPIVLIIFVCKSFGSTWKDEISPDFAAKTY